MKFLLLLVAGAYAACDCDTKEVAASCRSGGTDGKTFPATADAKCAATAVADTEAHCKAADDSQTTAKKCVWTAKKAAWTGTADNCALSAKKAAKVAGTARTQATAGVCVGSTDKAAVMSGTTVTTAAVVDANCKVTTLDTKAKCIAADDAQSTAVKCVWKLNNCAWTGKILAATARMDSQTTKVACAWTVGATTTKCAHATANKADTECDKTAHQTSQTGCEAAVTADTADAATAKCVYTSTTAAGTCASTTSSDNSCAWPSAWAAGDKTEANCETLAKTAAAGSCDCDVAASGSGATAVAKWTGTDDATTATSCLWTKNPVAEVAADVKRTHMVDGKAADCAWAPASTAVVSIFALVAAYLL